MAVVLDAAGVEVGIRAAGEEAVVAVGVETFEGNFAFRRLLHGDGLVCDEGVDGNGGGCR